VAEGFEAARYFASATPRKREALLRLLARTESIEEVNGASGHHITVGRKAEPASRL